MYKCNNIVKHKDNFHRSLLNDNEFIVFQNIYVLSKFIFCINFKKILYIT